MENKKKAIIICSGGLDSTTLLWKLVKEDNYKPEEVLAISFYYGQKHNKEIQCAKKQCDILNIQHKEINLSHFMKDFSSALIQEDKKIPSIEAIGDPQPLSYVPYRNGLFLMIACGIAESVEAKKVYYGAQLHDIYGYWDVSEDFVNSFNVLSKLNRKNQIQVYAPFAKYKKSDIAQKAIDLNLPLEYTWSCYEGREKACGKCLTCLERIKAFKDINKLDKVEYE